VNAIGELRIRVAQKTWDKEIVLWVGPETDLMTALNGAHVESLDILDLFDPSSLPINDDETHGTLIRKLRAKLKSVPRGPDQRTILVVRSVGLLARYDVGVKEFYDWFIGSFTMVILILEPSSPGFEWPEDVECEAGRIRRYFTAPGSLKQILEVES